ncbi:hypothetical protein ABK020_002050 [Vibrio cholerae]
MNFLYESFRLRESLIKINATNLTNRNVLILSIYYLLIVALSKLIIRKKKYKGEKSISITWSKTHENRIGSLTESSHVENQRQVKLGKCIPFKSLFFIQQDISLGHILMTSYRCSTGVQSFAFNFVSLAEYNFISSIIGNEVSSVCIAGHFDRYSYTINQVCQEKCIRLTVCQHGAMPRLCGLPKFVVDTTYLLYDVSKSYFERIFDCKNYLVVNDNYKDFKKINSGRRLPNDTVVFVGQQSNPKLNERIINLLILSDNAVCHIKHPLDDNNYNVSDEKRYFETDEFPSNPTLVVSRYSTLAYNYYLAGFEVVFVTDDRVDVDFISSSRVSKVKLVNLKYFLRERTNVQ